MALISILDYGVRVGEEYADSSPSTEEEQILAFLDDASALVLQIAALDTDWTEATVPAAVVPVIVNMVRRAVENPMGLSGEQIGSYQWQSSAANATAIYTTRDERRIIRRAAGSLGVGTVTLEGYMPTSGAAFVEDDLTEGLG